MSCTFLDANFSRLLMSELECGAVVCACCATGRLLMAVKLPLAHLPALCSGSQTRYHTSSCQHFWRRSADSLTTERVERRGNTGGAADSPLNPAADLPLSAPPADFCLNPSLADPSPKPFPTDCRLATEQTSKRECLNKPVLVSYVF